MTPFLLLFNCGSYTTKTVTAEGGINGVGIGSGYQTSSCEDIEIIQGTVTAKGSTDSTGIGAGRGSTSGNILIGDPNNQKKVIVNAEGGMLNDGGNIMSYQDSGHTKTGTITITGSNTSVRPGKAGEGLYSTSGIPAPGADKSVPVEDLPLNERLFCYPVYLRPEDPTPDVAAIEDPSKKLYTLPLPADAKNIKISAIPVSANGDSSKALTWTADLSHDPFAPNFAFIWMTGEDQILTVTYDSDTEGSGSKTLNLIFHEDAGVFRTEDQPDPPPAKKPEYTSTPTPPGEPGTGTPNTAISNSTYVPHEGERGIILQIGANYGEILEVPRFYLSSHALGLDRISIAAQKRALEAMPVLREAINRVSSIRGSYGALQNRLEHNINNLGQAVENMTDAESRIRDADMAEEYAKLVKLNILQQSAQAMLTQSNQNASRVLQLLQ